MNEICVNHTVNNCLHEVVVHYRRQVVVHFLKAAWLSGQGAGFAYGCSVFKSHSDSDHFLEQLSWAIPESNPPCFVNTRLVCLLSVEVFNCVMHVCVKLGEISFTATPKSEYK